MLKRTCLTTLFSLIALFAILFSFASCGKGGDYPEIKSTKEEATVVATLGDHEVKYELFRAYFSAMYSGRTAGMTEEGWNAAVRDVMREIACLYATFDVASENGVDPWGDKINAAVTELVRIQYEGGTTGDGNYVPGVGTREEYQKALAKANLTDAVTRLIYRYDTTLTELYDYVVTNLTYGNNTGLGGDARAFFDSDDCAHGVWVFISDGSLDGRENGVARADFLRDKLAGAADYADVKEALIRYAPQGVLSNDEFEHGFYVSKNQGNTPVQRALIADFFSLSPYECGEIREDADGVWFVVGLPKDASDYDRDPEAILDLMIEENWINRPIAEKAAAYLAGVSYTSAFPTFSAEVLSELTVR